MLFFFHRLVLFPFPSSLSIFHSSSLSRLLSFCPPPVHSSSLSLLLTFTPSHLHSFTLSLFLTFSSVRDFFLNFFYITCLFLSSSLHFSLAFLFLFPFLLSLLSHTLFPPPRSVLFSSFFIFPSLSFQLTISLRPKSDIQIFLATIVVSYSNIWTSQINIIHWRRWGNISWKRKFCPISLQMKILIVIEISNHWYNLHCFLWPYSVCEHVYRCHLVKFYRSWCKIQDLPMSNLFSWCKP